MATVETAAPAAGLRTAVTSPVEWCRRLARVFSSVAFWWVVCLCCAAVITYAARHSMNADGISYIDLATAAVDGGPGKLLNGYWSPGYPALIGVAFLVFRPEPAAEYALVHFVNFVIFIFALGGFSLFVRQWLKVIDCAGVQNRRRVYVVPFAFSTFLLLTLTCIGTEVVAPDLGLAGVIFSAAAIGCRVSLPGSTWKHYAALGAVLAAGYYVKAAMFPLSLALMVLLFCSSPRSRRDLKLVAAALSVFLALSAPLIAALSIRAGRPTFGETGRINYAWYVNETRWSSGLDPAEPGTTEYHPAPKLLSKPATLYFASPLGGTYPLWFDPSHWYAGARIHLDLRQQAAAIARNTSVLLYVAAQYIGLISGALVLCFLAFRQGFERAVRLQWWLIAWPAAAVGMYLLVYFESRFIGAFFVLGCLGVYGYLTGQVSRTVAGAVCATVVFASMMRVALATAKAGVKIATETMNHRPPEYEAIAAGLARLGLKRGDRLAVVGNAHDAYYARRAGLRIVAQIPDAREFGSLSGSELKCVEDRLASAGVNAIVAQSLPADSAPGDWKTIGPPGSPLVRVLLLKPDPDAE